MIRGRTANAHGIRRELTREGRKEKSGGIEGQEPARRPKVGGTVRFRIRRMHCGHSPHRALKTLIQLNRPSDNPQKVQLAFRYSFDELISDESHLIRY